MAHLQQFWTSNEYPLLVIPKTLTNLRTICDPRNNVIIEVKILSPDTTGMQTCIYSGLCNIKLIDGFEVDIQCMSPQNVQDIEDLPVIYAESQYEDYYDGYQNYNNDYNSYNPVQAPQYSFCHQTHSNHITVQHHNTYITQNVYNYNEDVRYPPQESLSRQTMPETQPNMYNIHEAVRYSPHESFARQTKEIQPLKRKIPNSNKLLNLDDHNECSAQEINKKVGNDSGIADVSASDALKQLMSSDIEPVSKQRRTILYSGPDDRRGRTIQQIAYNDPTIECSSVPIEVDNEVVIESLEPIPPNLKKYQCAKCEQIFDQLTEFRDHMNRHAIAQPKYKRSTRHSPTTHYVCNDCGKKMTDRKKFVIHCSAHGDPDLECSKCGKVFATKSSLKVHMKIHNRKYRCNFCIKSYTDVAFLRPHMAKFHSRFMCEHCTYVTSKKLDLLSHQMIHKAVYTSDGESNDTEYCFYEDSTRSVVSLSKVRDWVCDNYDENAGTYEITEAGQEAGLNYEEPSTTVEDQKGESNKDDKQIDSQQNQEEIECVFENSSNENLCDDQKLICKISVQNSPEFDEVQFETAGNQFDGHESQFDETVSQFNDNESQYANISSVSVEDNHNDEDFKMSDEGGNLSKIDLHNSVIAKAIGNEAFSARYSKKWKRKFCKVCDVCNKSFDRISDLKRHLIEHVIRSTLDKMPVSHTGTLNIKCEVCHKDTFQKIDLYKAHLREHAMLTLYRCTFCNKSFSDSSNFSKHKKIHGARYFQCDLCQRKFNSKKMIALHMEYHKQNAPLPCPMCGKKFHFESTLKKHVKGSHAKRTNCRFKCRFCLKYFSTLKGKWDHEWNAHKIRKMIVDCLLCGAKFRKYSELKRHCLDEHNVEIPPAKSLLTDDLKKETDKMP